MIVIPSVNTAWFDVDDTLVLWNPTKEQLEKDGIEFECPGSLVLVDDQLLPSTPWKAFLVPHKVHIEQLKKHKLRGHKVVVWSAGGWDWAESVVRALKLEQFVDVVISKPNWAYDDKQPHEYMPKSQWMKDE
jgi:hypothetical protein